jgi:hypothetical protein
MFDSYDETDGVGFLDRIWDGAKVGGAAGGVLGLGVGAIPGAVLGGLVGLADAVGAQYQENNAYANWQKNLDHVDDPLLAAAYGNRTDRMSDRLMDEAEKNGDDPASVTPDDVMKRMFREDYAKQREVGLGERLWSCFGGLFGDDEAPAQASPEPDDVVSTKPQVAPNPIVQAEKAKTDERLRNEAAADYDKKLKAYDAAYREWAARDRAWGDAGKAGEAPGKPSKRSFGVTGPE